MTPRTALPLAALIGLFSFGLAACEQGPTALVLKPAPNCEAAAEPRESTNYWLYGETPKRLNWAGCDKSGAGLHNAALGGANLTGTNLAKADLSHADLGAALVRDADLSGANLQGAILSAAYFDRVNMKGANLSQAVMTGGTYLEVDFSGATWTDGEKVCAPGSVGHCN